MIQLVDNITNEIWFSLAIKNINNIKLGGFNMLIRSQDRKCFVNTDNVFSTNIYGADDEYVIDATNNIGTETLGVYSSEEKALKVLDMICSAYDRYSRKCIDFSSTEGGLYKTIFGMPKDEDVVITDENGVIICGN